MKNGDLTGLGAGLFCLKLKGTGQLPVESETGLLGLNSWNTLERL